ncbi:exo-alpha-sialidase [soil metagenome]
MSRFTTCICCCLLLLTVSSSAQLDLIKALPDVAGGVSELMQFRRINDMKKRRNVAGESSMDWARWKAWEKIKQTGERNAQPGNQTTVFSTWENAGPLTKSGRIISIAFHPTDTNIIYAGAASGGLWRSVNYGSTWQPLTDNFPTMGIGAVALNHQNPSSIIIATGEGYDFGGEFTSGFGIFISHDAGLTWDTTNITAGLGDSFAGMDIAWNPNDTTKVCITTSFGVYFSSDGGATYSYVLDRLPARMIQDPQNPARLYLVARYYTAAYPGGFYRSTNSGQTWTLVTGSGLPALTDIGYASIAVHPVYNNIIYLNISQSSLYGIGPMQGLYKSADFGNTFVEVPTNVDIHCYQVPFDNVCQGWYDNTIVMSPSDTNVLIAGGTRFWKSIDGGFTWNNCDLDSTGTIYQVHPDHHQTLFHPLTGHLFDCNDGGINYSADEGLHWNYIGDGLITHQFYTIASAETDSEVVIGGAQDVGIFSSTTILTVDAWENEFSGDGFGCAIDYLDEDVWYGTLFFSYSRIRSNNAGLNWTQINNGTSTDDQWRMPMVMHPTDHQTLLTSNDNYMYKTINGGLSWQQMAATGYIGCFEYDQVNANVIYGSLLYGGTIYRSIDGGTQWFQLTSSPGSPVTDLAADPQNVGVVYASVGSFANQDQVFKSVNGGLTWTNVSGNLPPVPVNTLAVDPWDDLIIYAGTDLGVWVTQDGGVSWSSFNVGLPWVVVDDMHFYKPDTTIRIGTYGRGFWRTKAIPVSASSVIAETNGIQFISSGPNPISAGNHFSVHLLASSTGNEKTIFILVDQLGKEISRREEKFQSGEHELDFTAPPSAGLYLLSIQTGKRNFIIKIPVYK